MRIISLNAWGGSMWDELAAWVPVAGADVLCVQEVTRTKSLEGWTEFTDEARTLPQRANLFKDLCAAMPQHEGVFVASDSGPVTDSDGSIHRQDFGIAILLADHLTVIGHHTAYVHGDYTDHDKHWAVNRPRIAHAVRVMNPRSDRTATVVHLHGLRDPAGKHDTPEREAQARRLCSLILHARQPGDDVIVCGDLNILPSSSTFSILAEAGLSDLVGTSDTRTSRYTKPVRSANYLMVSNPSNVSSFAVSAHPEVSDHRPLILDLR